jgi:hypothetical protein
MNCETPRLARRVVCMLYEGLVVFSILLIGFLLPQIVFLRFRPNAERPHADDPHFFIVNVLLLMVLA